MPLDISQYYQITPLDGSGDVIVRRAEEPPIITAGGARWKSVSRPKRTSVALFDGVDAYEMDVPILFDGWIPDLSIESLVARINQMRFPQKALHAPTRIRVTGGVPIKGAIWIIKDISWGTNVIWKARGQKASRYRQDAILHLLQYLPEQALKGIKQFDVSNHVIVMKSGQTHKDLTGGDPKKTKDLQKANHIRDPKTIGNKPGQKIVVPFTPPGHINPPKGWKWAKNTGSGAKNDPWLLKRV